MEELNKKVIGNAMSAYFLVIVSIFFLWSKQPYVNHSFVKSHVKSAFILHVLLFFMLYIMSFSFLDSVEIFQYSINTIITIILSLGIFGAMLYGMSQAHMGKTVSIGEIFHSAGVSKQIIQNTSTEKLKEEENFLLILAHVPFLGYIIYPRHKNLPHIRDISQLNLLVTLLSCAIFILGYTSLASVCMLLYIIWSVLQSLFLIFHNEILTMNLSKIPTPEETYLYNNASVKYLGNTLKKTSFVSFANLVSSMSEARRSLEKSDIETLKKLKKSSLPSWIYYIPIINCIGVFFMNTYDRFHIKNGSIITLIFIVLIIIFGWDSSVLILVLFPVCYGIGYIDRKAYRIPYIYDIYSLLTTIFGSISHIFKKTRKLQKTEINESIKMNETKKETQL